MTEPHENSITLDFSQGAYVDLEDLSIWIADQQATTNPLYAHWVANELLNTKGLELAMNKSRVCVDEKLREKVNRLFNIQLPNGAGQGIPAPIKGKPESLRKWMCHVITVEKGLSIDEALPSGLQAELIRRATEYGYQDDSAVKRAWRHLKLESAKQ